jgi:predicted nucleotidyltransferase
MPSVERNADDRSDHMDIEKIEDVLNDLKMALELAKEYPELSEEYRVIRREWERLRRSKFIKSFMLLDENENYVRDIREADKITGYDKEVPEEYDVM